MSEKRVYQDKMLSSKKEIVVCNWERGEGKTYSILTKMLRYGRRVKFLYISKLSSIGLKNVFEEYINKSSKFINSYELSKDKILLEFTNGDSIEVFISNTSDNFRGERNIDIIFCDEYFPSKDSIESVLKPMGAKQIFIMMTNDNIEYIDSRNLINIDNFYNKQIEELMIEYSNISKTEKTTLTRENILKQIKMLQDMEVGK